MEVRRGRESGRVGSRNHAHGAATGDRMARLGSWSSFRAGAGARPLECDDVILLELRTSIPIPQAS